MLRNSYWQHHGHPKIPFIGLIHTCLDQNRANEDFGTNVAIVNVDGTLGTPKPKQKGLLGVVARYLWIIATSRITGEYRKSPLFTSSGMPLVDPKVLSSEELAKLKNAG